jgi:hypothetical protein
MSATARPVDSACRAYAVLLRLMPADFRAAYGEPAVQTFRDLCAAGLRTRGRRGLLAVCLRTLPDFAISALREWTARLWRRTDGRPPAASRWGAATIAVTGALLVIYSQLRYPANLSRPDYLMFYVLLLSALAVLVGVFLTGRAGTPVAVGSALATAPGWLLAFHLNSPGAGAVALGAILAAVGFASAWPAIHGSGLVATIRTGLATGVLAGAVMLTVTVADGLATMGSVNLDTVYVHEFVRSGQSSLAAYTIGERISGGFVSLLLGMAVGALAGVVAGAAGALARPSTQRG